MIRHEISTVSHKIDELKPTLIEEEIDPSVLTEIETRDEIKRLKDSVSVYTSRTWLLIDALPNNDALEKRISDINKRVDNFVGEASDIEAEAGQRPPLTNVKVSNKTFLTLGKGLSVQDDINIFQWEVFNAADKAAEAAEYRYKWATWTSWLFYEFGWLLTFTARLLGVKGIEGGNGWLPDTAQIAPGGRRTRRHGSRLGNNTPDHPDFRANIWHRDESATTRPEFTLFVWSKVRLDNIQTVWEYHRSGLLFVTCSAFPPTLLNRRTQIFLSEGFPCVDLTVLFWHVSL
jgi:hypothetical protein